MTPLFQSLNGRAIFVINGRVLTNDERVKALEMVFSAAAKMHKQTNQFTRVGIISFFGQPHVTTNVPHENFNNLVAFVGTLTSSDRIFVDNSTAVSTQSLEVRSTFKQKIFFGFSLANKITEGFHSGYAKRRNINKTFDYRLSLLGAKIKLCENSYRVLLGEPSLYQDDGHREIIDITAMRGKRNNDSNMFQEMERHALIYEELITTIKNQCSCKHANTQSFLDSVIGEFQELPVNRRLELFVD